MTSAIHGIIPSAKGKPATYVVFVLLLYSTTLAIRARFHLDERQVELKVRSSVKCHGPSLLRNGVIRHLDVL